MTLGWSGVPTDPVILDSPNQAVLVGRYSVFATFNERLQSLIDACHPDPHRERIEPVSVIGSQTRAAITQSLTCEAMKAVPPTSAARDGALTESVWRAVMGNEPVPGIAAKTAAIVATFEDTDFGDPPKWSFCQDTPNIEALLGRTGAEDLARIKCYNSSDRCALLTWGPRGATAGLDREIQWVLWIAWREKPELVENAFGSEFPDVRRFFHLDGPRTGICNGDTALEHFLCSVWIDPERRERWSAALVELGRSSVIRDIYAKLYASRDFDGSKLKDYASLWRNVGLTPSEIDYAFFVDRATQYGGPFETEAEADLVERMLRCMRREDYAYNKNGAARRCLSFLEPHPTLPLDRLGRDVAFYREFFPPERLSRVALSIWERHKPLSVAHDFNLSDAKKGPAPSPESLLPLSERGPDVRPTPPPYDYCPANILSPLKQSQ